jgi:hypothetical protein
MEILFLIFFICLFFTAIIIAVQLLVKLNEEERKLDWIYSVSEMSQSHPGSEYKALEEISDYIERNGNTTN